MSEKREQALETFWHDELPDILAQVSADRMDPMMAHALIHKSVTALLWPQEEYELRAALLELVWATRESFMDATARRTLATAIGLAVLDIVEAEDE